MISKEKRKIGFTLAEVLIVIGILGIISAMTIPNLLTKISKRQIETKTQVAYSLLYQTMQLADSADNTTGTTILDFNDESMKDWFRKFIQPHIKVLETCYNTYSCWHEKGEVKDLNGNKAWYSDNAGMGLNTLSFTTAKGISFSIDGWGTLPTLNSIFGIKTAQDSLIVYFDANGRSKPNKIGKDIYVAVYIPERGLLPAGTDKTQAEIEQNCLKGNGYWCLAYIKRNNWKIPDEVWKR